MHKVQRPTDRHYTERERDLETLSPKRGVFIKSFSSGCRKLYGRTEKYRRDEGH